MKKNIKSFGLLLVAGMALVACSSDDTDEQNAQQQNNHTWQAYATVGKGMDMDTRTLRIESGALKVGWDIYDFVYVFRGATKVGFLTPSSSNDNYFVTMSGSIDGNAYQAGETLSFRFPRETVDYTGQDGTLLSIARKYDYAEGGATVSSVTGTNVQLGTVSLYSKQAIVKFTFDKAIQVVSIYSDAMSEPILVEPSSATTEIYAALPLTGSVISTDYVLSGVDADNKQFMTRKTGVTMENGKYYEASIRLLYPTYVDLGLSVNWYVYNMGASDITAKGNGYAWGERVTKDTYTLDNYRWYTSGEYTKYVLDSSYGTVDNKTTLDPEDDVAYSGTRHIPTKDECQELLDNTVRKGFQLNGSTAVYSMFISTKSGYKGSAIIFIDNWAVWASTLSSTRNAYTLRGSSSLTSSPRYTDWPVRPVVSK